MNKLTPHQCPSPSCGPGLRSSWPDERDQETKRGKTMDCGFQADKVILFCPGSLTSSRDVLPAEPAAVPAPSQVPHPQVPPKEHSTVSASRLLRLHPHL